MNDRTAWLAVRRAVIANLADADPNGLVLVACSGGADSLALAAGAAISGRRVGAVVVDHGLPHRLDAGRDRVELVVNVIVHHIDVGVRVVEDIGEIGGAIVGDHRGVKDDGEPCHVVGEGQRVVGDLDELDVLGLGTCPALGHEVRLVVDLESGHAVAVSHIAPIGHGEAVRPPFRPVVVSVRS